MAEPYKRDYRKAKNGAAIRCQHGGCGRPAIERNDEPIHQEFHGEDHDCCGQHGSRPKS